MLKKIIGVVFLSVFILFGFFGFIKAQTENSSVAENNNESFPGENIKIFNSEIRVNTDNSIDVTDKIIYDTGDSGEHHGIYRDIFTNSSQDRKMSFSGVSVTDEAGNDYRYTTSNNGNVFEIKIGDPDVTFSGQKTYIIKYHVAKAVAQLKTGEVDEIYWNVTGNEWAMPINEVKATIILPPGVSSKQLACYWGTYDSTATCESLKINDQTYEFYLPNSLSPYEGLTVAVGFPKGFVIPYSFADNFADFFFKYLGWLIVLALPLMSLFFSLRHWYKYGRDPKGAGVIVAQYDVPEGLTPMEVSGIVRENISNSNISAEIIYLATKGYLNIKQIDDKVLGLFKTTDYELTKLKDFSDLPNDFDQKLLKGLFSSSTQTVKISDLMYEFSGTAQSVVTKALNSLVTKKYYSNLGRLKSGFTGWSSWFVILFVAIWASGFLGIIFGVILFSDNPFLLVPSIFLSIIIYGVVSHFFPAKTVEGVRLKEYLLGLKEYLQIAEKDRLQFHNAPEKKPEVFEKLLPYAMVLGVSDIWAKEFEDIYMTPPSWYSSSSMQSFSALNFSHTLASFSTYTASTFSATHSSGGGSGGGGFSGGGGGGGGGGSW